MTKIYLIRHGFSMGNELRLMAGHYDLDLSDVGVRQAQETAQLLADVPFSYVYSSDLLRARRTAIPHLAYHDVPLELREDLREVYLGEWEGVPRDTLEGKNEEYERFFAEFGTAVVPGSGSIFESGKRFYKTVCEIAAKHDGQTILIVSHAAFIRALVGTALGLRADEYREKLPFPSNASVQILEYDGERLNVIEYASDSHLCTKTKIPEKSVEAGEKA